MFIKFRSENEPEEDDVGQDEIFLPLTDSEGKLLPVHFLTCEEVCFTIFVKNIIVLKNIIKFYN